ncbi:retinol dehydrogenase 8-like [Clytia hemisphaerica]|uniref:Uncharacterized protein n=1 Tax=Clytia hemisphaerica TaxID=252671 RepID=A0A7M5XI70_9CNID|eukprot:TCONS_00010295-protein
MSERTTNTKVVLIAIDSSNTLLLKCCIEMLKMSKLGDYHFHLTTVSQDEETLSNLVVLKELNHRLFFHQTDVRSDDSVRQTIHNVLQIESRIDVLVCHIENRTIVDACSTNSNTVNHVLEENFYPNFRFITNIIEHMKSSSKGGLENDEKGGNDGGKIILLNSYAGMQGISHSSAFCATRFALNGLVQSAAAETLSSKIRFCVLQTVLQKMPCALLSTEANETEPLSNEDRELIQSIDDDLEKRKLLAEYSISDTSKSLKTLFTTDFPDLRQFTNKAIKSEAYDKFIDPKGMKTLSETVQFYLNLDLDEFREERKTKMKFNLLKKTSSHFRCTSSNIVI